MVILPAVVSRACDEAEVIELPSVARGGRDVPSTAASAEDDDPSLRLAEAMDRSLHYLMSRFTFGLSPMAMAQAYFDWSIHLSSSPDKQAQLWHKGVRKAARLAVHVAHCAMGRDNAPCIAPLPHDKRFAAKAWQGWPYSVAYQSFLLQQQWWHNAVTDVHGVSQHHERVLQFAFRQWLEHVFSIKFSSHQPGTSAANARRGGSQPHPRVLELGGGLGAPRPQAGLERFKVGENIAATPGKVVYRNRLMELIQYVPTTAEVKPEPILIVPAWIMKYYILDLSRQNSLVRYLVDQGFTVFMISWKNPGKDDRDLGMEDFHVLGPQAALEVISRIVPQHKVHGVGYCLGGTLLAASAAAFARDRDERLQSLSLFAAQTDFTEAGELTLFIGESEIAFLEDMMWEQGYLEAGQMAGTFQLLRSNDLIWSKLMRSYLLGERPPTFDLLAWNADATRMPYRMHSEYLRRLFLQNDLAEGRYPVGGHPVALSDIRVPVFVVATETDHIAPWRSVFKCHLLMDTDITFVLTSGGHNAGVVSELERKDRHYRIAAKRESDRYHDPDTWEGDATEHTGSWWTAWVKWLARHSGKPTRPSSMGAPERGLPILGSAPGRYVLEP
jgi:polyhydroxyalkanoate synthase subunit PhaC